MAGRDPSQQALIKILFVLPDMYLVFLQLHFKTLRSVAPLLGGPQGTARHPRESLGVDPRGTPEGEGPCGELAGSLRGAWKLGSLEAWKPAESLRSLGACGELAGNLRREAGTWKI